MSDHPDPGRSVLSVRQLNEAIRNALHTAFQDPVWVRGEVQRLPPDAATRKHVYFELHEGTGGGAATFQIPTTILGWDRERFGLGRYLDGSDPAFRLQNQLEVCLLCRVDFHPPFGRVNLKVVGVDPEFSLGRLEAERRRVLAWLRAEGLLELNGLLPMPDLPLRVGLITSAGSAAEHDVRAGLDESGFPFGVMLADCRMQGEQTAPQVSAALAHLARQNLDVVVVTRGGGSRADLSWFDQQAICEAIARCGCPVVAAIGHEIDTSLADLCAHTSCKTPTAAAEFLVERVQQQHDRVQSTAERLARHALASLDTSAAQLEIASRVGPLASRSLRESSQRLRAVVATLEARTGRLVARHDRRIHAFATRLAAGFGQSVAAAQRRVDYLAERVALEGTRASLASRLRVDHLAEKIGLLDPARVLERGFTMTFDASGRTVTTVDRIRPGQVIRTRFADGDITSTVHGPTVRRRSETDEKGDSSDPEEGSGQQALF